MTNDDERLRPATADAAAVLEPALRRQLAKRPDSDRLVWWVTLELNLSDSKSDPDSKSDAKRARALWQTHWRARAWMTIRAFTQTEGGDVSDLVQFVKFVKSWTGDTTNPGRILRMNATQWTPLERQLVAAWAAKTFQKRHLAIAWNRRVSAQALEDTVQDFWKGVHYEGEGGPLRGYVYDPKNPREPEDQFRVYLDKCVVNHCQRAFGGIGGQPLPTAPPPVHGAAGRTPAITRDDLARCARALTSMERQVLQLHLMGHTPAEIAKLLGTRPGAVRVRLFKARQKLRACLGLPLQPTSATLDAPEKLI
jgi:DNA-directed RNA polymerase specialized sigma24 family protein